MIMPAKVFISCGQASDQERMMARGIREWLAGGGYSTYVAAEIQTIRELNSQIIEALKSSDSYLFINLPRENIESATMPRLRRGLQGQSVFVLGSVFVH